MLQCISSLPSFIIAIIHQYPYFCHFPFHHQFPIDLFSPSQFFFHRPLRLILSMDSRHGEISRAMRNRGVEIYMLGEVQYCVTFVICKAIIIQLQFISLPLIFLLGSSCLRMINRIHECQTIVHYFVLDEVIFL